MKREERKFAALAGLLALVMLWTLAPASNAANVAGGACKKLGEIVKSGDQNLICDKFNGQSRYYVSGGTLKYGYTGGGLVALNPNQISSGTQKPVAPLLYDSLVRIDSKGAIVPWLASSWTSTADQKSWTLVLREGVKFHSGREFTNQDVRRNLEWISTPANKSSQAGEIGKISSYSLKGRYQVTINLKNANSQFPGALVFVYMADPITLSNPKVVNGTGPFKLQKFASDDHVYVTNNRGYWAGSSKLDGIKVMRSPDATSALLSLQSGALDMVWNIPPTSIAQVRADKNLGFLTAPAFTGAHVLMLDTKSAPFNNVKARQALSYALDRETIFKTAFGSVGEISMTSTPIGLKDSAYKSGMTEYNFNLDKAKVLFAEAGVKSGDTLTFWTLAGRRYEWVTMAQVLQSDLKKIGITLDIKPQETASWLGKFFPYSASSPKLYPDTIVANFLSPVPTSAYQLNAYTTGGNEAKWDNAEYDALMKSALSASSAAEYKTITGKMQELYNREVPCVIPLLAANITAYNSSVKGMFLLGEGTPQLQDAYFG